MKKTTQNLKVLALLWPLPILYQIVGPAFPSLLWAQVGIFLMPSFVGCFFLSPRLVRAKSYLRPLLCWGAVTIGLSLIFNFTLPWVFQIFPVPADLEFLFAWETAKTGWGFGVDLFKLALVPAVCEEFYFRGIVFGSLREQFGFRTAAGAATLYFALTHFNPWLFLQLLILGWVFARAYEKTGLLRGAILCHFLNNAVSLTLVFFGWIPE